MNSEEYNRSSIYSSKIVDPNNFEKIFLPLLSEKTRKIMEDYINEGDEPMDHLDDSYDYIGKETEVIIDTLDPNYGYYYTIYKIDNVFFYTDPDLGYTYFCNKLSDLLSDIEFNICVELNYDGKNYLGQLNHH